MKSATIKKVPLTSNWRVRENPRDGISPSSQLGWLPATVPGCIHTDLMNAGIISDPFFRMQERGVAWVDHTSWIYETEFFYEPSLGETYLQFEGIDTVTDIFLNGKILGRTDNMFIPHEFIVGNRLLPGKNVLQLKFFPAIQTGNERQRAWKQSGQDTLSPDWFVWGPRAFIRKAQYMFGWDWGPELVSCGIFRPVALCLVPIARLIDSQFFVEFLPDDKGRLRVKVLVERMPKALEAPLSLRVHLPAVGNINTTFETTHLKPILQNVPTGTKKVEVSFEIVIKSPQRWFPLGYGENKIYPPLYQMNIDLLYKEECIDTKQSQIGLRTIALVQQDDPDQKGQSFQFRVNDQDIFIKGANWIPADTFLSRLSWDEYSDAKTSVIDNLQNQKKDTRVYRLIQLAAEAGFTMLRIWGGGFYESDHFYELCDQLGILVWQDFPYACSYYPDQKEYAKSAEKEACTAIHRLRNHPSLAIWCGNNENQQMHHDGWSGLNRPPRFLGKEIFHKILPELLFKEDPERPYVPGSPYGGNTPNSQEKGDRHNWDVWHGKGDWIHYINDNSRFVSEFGFASSCGMSAWEHCLLPEDKTPYSPAVKWHDKTRKGYKTYLEFIELHYPSSTALEDLIYYSQLNQAEAMRCALEHWRRQKGHCWGTLLWQLNDCWPAQSWSLIDSALEPKASYYAVKRAYQPVLLSLFRQKDEVEIHLINDLFCPLSGKISFTVETFAGEVIYQENFSTNIEANCAKLIKKVSLICTRKQEKNVFLLAKFIPTGNPLPKFQNEMIQSVLFLEEPKNLDLLEANLTITLQDKNPQLFHVTIFAKTFAPYVSLSIKDAPYGSGQNTWSDNFFHLPANCSYQVSVPKQNFKMESETLQKKLCIRSFQNDS